MPHPRNLTISDSFRFPENQPTCRVCPGQEHSRWTQRPGIFVGHIAWKTRPMPRGQIFLTVMICTTGILIDATIDVLLHAASVFGAIGAIGTPLLREQTASTTRSVPTVLQTFYIKFRAPVPASLPTAPPPLVRGQLAARTTRGGAVQDLCRDLCRNRPIPARVGGSRALSLGYTSRAAKRG